MNDVCCKRCYVSGRVQGVFYRASTAGMARQLGVCGSVRNLADGRVGVIAIGEKGAVDALCHWLREGPPGARVDDVVVEDIDPASLSELPTGFSIG